MVYWEVASQVGHSGFAKEKQDLKKEMINNKTNQKRKQNGWKICGNWKAKGFWILHKKS